MRYAGVVVTCNRKELLQECIDALLAQSCKLEAIIIVDNASTDGTADLFAGDGKYAGEEQIDYLCMRENLGGAGGFFEGIKYAYEHGYDWIWIMDDDAIPNFDALEKLIEGSRLVQGEISFLASAVYAEHGELMNVPEIDERKGEYGYAEWGKYLTEGIVKIETATFVSILINRMSIEKAGLPYRQFFIWGDDTEYTFRLTRNCAPGYLIGKSIVTHKRKLVKNITIEFEEDDRRIDQFYYRYRNNLVNNYTYRNGIVSVVKTIIIYEKTCVRILHSKSKKKWKKIMVIHKGILGFLFGKYDRKKFKRLIVK